jgi:hypothetical protein
MATATPSRPRRGNYSVLFALTLPIVLGFGAFAVDLTWIRMAQHQSQDVADAATQAAMIALRATGNQGIARSAAESVVSSNDIAGGTGELLQLDFGVWDESSRTFTATGNAPNAVRARVGRTDSNGVPYMLARIWGYDRANVEATSTSAARALQVILDMDITGSWTQTNFAEARNAAVNFLDTLTLAYGDDDLVGMVNFTNRFGIEFTRLSPVADEASTHAIRTQWEGLNVASKAGNPGVFPAECSVHDGAAKNDFSAGPHAAIADDPVHEAGGCYPKMFREYDDESGTDHTVGLEMARQMFEAEPNPSIYRVLVMLTDGIPNGFTTAGTKRAASGYVETRWPFYPGPIPHTTADIETESNAIADDLWGTLQVNQWDISFVADAGFMHTMPKGDGYFKLANNSAALVPIFADIAQGLPISVVE